MSPQSIPVAFKIVTKVNWTRFLSSGVRESWGFDKDLVDEFIHLSTEKQLMATLDKNFKSVDKSTLFLIAVNLRKSEVKWETAKNGLVYPHLYSPLIPGENILWTWSIDEDGSFRREMF